MGKNLHETPFTPGTIAKLQIFENYAEAWLPAFTMQGRSKICIFDLFAGTGYDITGTPGSPIRILEKINGQIDQIIQKGVTIELYLNEFEPDRKEQKKFDRLRDACTKFLGDRPRLESRVILKFYNEDFELLFPKLRPIMQEYPSLVYLDQNGIKFLSDRFLMAFETMRETDFLYFVSSSYFARFGNTPEFKMHLDIDLVEAKKNGFRSIHRSILDQLRKKLPASSKLKLYPFSILKGTNVYGIIFGATHPLAVDKFLNIAWSANSVNGEADFDIDEEAINCQMDLFGTKKLTKLERFAENVKVLVLNGKINSNFDLLDFAYQEGHKGSQAADILKEMKRRGEVYYQGVSPLVTYQNVHRLGKALTYTPADIRVKTNLNR